MCIWPQGRAEEASVMEPRLTPDMEALGWYQQGGFSAGADPRRAGSLRARTAPTAQPPQARPPTGQPQTGKKP